MIRSTENNEYYELTSPTKIPKASGFLWNDNMMIHMNCRGYAVAQFMQPEPAKYSHSPNLEAKTFMQPEQPYYAHHPGRFVFVKDEENGDIFSAPYEPVRVLPDNYTFAVGKNNIIWKVESNGVLIEMKLSLPKDDPYELWEVKVKNLSNKKRKLSIYPYYTVGYMSWMNQSGEYLEDIQAIVCSSITPYQKYQDYAKIKELNDKTFLLAEKKPFSWEVSQEVFEGEGGITLPTGIQEEALSKSDSRYEMPTAVFQYKLEMDVNEEQSYRFVFGPAKYDEDVTAVRNKYFEAENEAGEDGFVLAEKEYAKYIAEGSGCLQIKTPDAHLDNFVNHWLPRQIYYHGITNRLSTDPQTRNYLQDNMGMSYIKPSIARHAFVHALSQQESSGAMPDGITIHEDAELKYINQVPHTDHCVWLPICLSTYLDETNDYAILDEVVPFADGNEEATVMEHINRAMYWLINDRDERGLNYINQGDWCDPMNMVGYKGKGVSGWLTTASAYAFMIWADICEKNGLQDNSEKFRQEADKSNEVINKYLWDGEWYARGITDDNVVFGISKDKEGRIFLNSQGWALLSGAADEVKKEKLLKSVVDQLESPYGVEMLGPAYTAMREDVGRVTQKHPGSAENGSVYNHAAVFYIYALYTAGETENAYRLLRKMIPGPDLDDIIQRGQLPVFIPNYYRGAYRTIPRTAGRSSHLFNTGTVSWVYRCIVDGLFGVQGAKDGLRIQPQLPADWQEASVTRSFRGADIEIDIRREAGIRETELYVNGDLVEGNVMKDLKSGEKYKVLVKVQ
ncbi:GH36-type glycosyl hydrolase domain-containing protein [Evansella cellulosilytica]|uniref:Glycosyltransferase 36 n=1 Tax=Evansella cellulosilytica (strain ATCC 21833 / DSM 2522 / FERM P-1141 / JCM 9156 / N-4) TaxID=649639 RepID=E6TWS7_EVAC2|nr:amylo-alpha-1,6-glucosidase [Evansella cellulosilytica]ADU28760.1 glycosyltransferase 36 [Evansella cellulosilytica DSM 2522]